MLKGTDLLTKLGDSDSIPSEVDYDKIQGNGGWSLKQRVVEFWPDDEIILRSLDLTADINDYKYMHAVQDKTYVAENGKDNKVSGDYINRDF